MSKFKLSSMSVFLSYFLATFCMGETLAVVGDFSAAPKVWLNKDGKAQGIMIDLLEEVSNRTDIQFTYSLSPWNRALMISSKGHGAIIGFSKNNDRLKVWDYTESMYFDELVIVTLKTRQFKFTGLESLSGKKLAIKRGSSYGDDFDLAIEMEIFEAVEMDDRIGQIRMLSLGRVDAILLSPGKFALEAIIAENHWLQEHQDEFIILKTAYKRDPNYIGIPKSMQKSHLINPINQALRDIKNDGTHQKIVDKNINVFLDLLTQ